MSETLVEELGDHKDDIVAADLSTHGWLTVQRCNKKSSFWSSFLNSLSRRTKSLISGREGPILGTETMEGMGFLREDLEKWTEELAQIMKFEPTEDKEVSRKIA